MFSSTILLKEYAASEIDYDFPVAGHFTSVRVHWFRPDVTWVPQRGVREIADQCVHQKKFFFFTFSLPSFTFFKTFL